MQDLEEHLFVGQSWISQSLMIVTGSDFLGIGQGAKKKKEKILAAEELRNFSLFGKQMAF